MPWIRPSGLVKPGETVTFPRYLTGVLSIQVLLLWVLYFWTAWTASGAGGRA